MIKFLHNLALFWVKNANFLLNFSAKIFKNHNIGRWFKNSKPLLKRLKPQRSSLCITESFLKKLRLTMP
jgi:hypothetical protein